jgi:tetratricopeptide (TPR) repeat protein
MEASPTPGKALPAANSLRDAMPGAGHLVHMPSHIDVLVGDYDAAVLANQRAVQADGEYVKMRGSLNFYTLYRVHNYHFIVYAAMFDAQSELAFEAAEELVRQIPAEMLEEIPDFLEAFVPTPYHVYVRFGRWDEILELPEPAADLFVTRAVWHYARALAFASTGRVEEAVAEKKAFDSAIETIPETRLLFNNSSRSILSVAEAMIDGEIEYRRGNFDVAFEHLREAVRRDDKLNYDEPWGWMQPARHSLGALLLEQERAQEAEEVYRADLKRHPSNAWSLHGLAESLEQQGKTEAAAKVRNEFDTACSRADVGIKASCYCAQSAME